MNFLAMLAVGCAIVVGSACTGPDKHEAAPVVQRFGPPVVREGIVYTPAAVGREGCVLYNIQIPGGKAPAAMVYQSAEGSFSYRRPNQCVKLKTVQPSKTVVT